MQNGRRHGSLNCYSVVRSTVESPMIKKKNRIIYIQNMHALQAGSALSWTPIAALQKECVYYVRTYIHT